MTMSNEGTASAGSHPPLVSPLRRLSICRQLSDVLKYRRKSCCSNSSDHLTNIPTPSPTGTTNSASSTFTFVWNCALTEVDSPPGSSSNEDLHVLPVQYPQRVRKNGLSDDPHVVNVKEITGSMVAACLIKQKSVSCDDVAFLSSSGDEQTICPSGSSAAAVAASIAYKAKPIGLSSFSFFLTFSFPSSPLDWKKDQSSLKFFLFFFHLEKEHGLASCSRMNNRALAKTSAGKERHEKRNSTGSAVLITVSFIRSRDVLKISAERETDVIESRVKELRLPWWINTWQTMLLLWSSDNREVMIGETPACHWSHQEEDDQRENPQAR